MLLVPKDIHPFNVDRMLLMTASFVEIEHP